MKKDPVKILLVEDDLDAGRMLATFLCRLGHVVRTAQSGQAALLLLDEDLPDLVLSDINLPGLSGLEVLMQVKAHHPELPVIMMTAFSSVDSAVESMRRGAVDYLVKPLQLSDTQIRIERALEQCRSRARLGQLEEQVRDRYHFGRIIGRSAPMQRMFQVIERVARTDATVLISGRTGTGKELVARAIHYNGKRAGGPLVDINCGALPEQLIAAELFGHQKGAFTGATETKKGLFETAQGGTIFLDEVQALKPELQTMLLRALQERTIRRVGGRDNIDIDVRVLCATNRDIADAARRGEFREDLYYRLNVVGIYLPELRDRREDLPLLIDHFLMQAQSGSDRPSCHFSPDARKTLLNYEWPGNVRELQNAVECALAIGQPPTLVLEDLPPQISGLSGRLGGERAGGPRTLDEVERQHILRVLNELGQNHTRAAEILGIDRRTLYRKLEKYKIEYTE